MLLKLSKLNLLLTNLICGEYMVRVVGKGLSEDVDAIIWFEFEEEFLENIFP